MKPEEETVQAQRGATMWIVRGKLEREARSTPNMEEKPQETLISQR